MTTTTTTTTAPAAASPPGPKGYPLVGNLPGYARDPLGFVTRCFGRYGDVVELGIVPSVREYGLNRPDLIERVLVGSNRGFVKGTFERWMLGFLGDGLLVSEGDSWRRQRRLMQPAFHRRRVEAYGETMVAYAERMLEGWRDGEERDVHEDMTRLTLEVVAKTLFDRDIGGGEAGEVGGALGTVMGHFSEQGSALLTQLLPGFVPTPGKARFRRAVGRLDGIIYGIIEERRRKSGVAGGGEDTGDLLSMLLSARDEETGEGMTDRQLRDEALTIILAGHETTAIALSWTWWLLGEHPEAEGELLKELREVLDGRAPTVEDLGALRYADAVVKESMRLYPPVWIVSRQAVEDTEIGGYRVPAGTELTMSQWVTHRDPRYFKDPESFRPERWLDGSTDGLPRYAYFPFGGGPRLCIGSGFAKMEAVLLLATIAQRFRLAPVPGWVPVPQPSITLRPRNGVKVALEERA